MVLLSIFAFLCPPTWSHEENVDCPHLYHVIMGLCTLIVGVLKYFLIFGGFVRLDPFGDSSYGAFVEFCFSLSAHVIAWGECWLSTPVSCDHGIVHLDCWVLKYFLIFGGFVRFDSDPLGHFVLWCFCSIFTFLCPYDEYVDAHWLHDENVDCPHLYHVIMGSYTLIVIVLKYFLIFGGFCPLWFWFFWSFVLWCFCPILLLSVLPRDRMRRMLIIHTCIMWSWDRAPWLLEY